MLLLLLALASPEPPAQDPLPVIAVEDCALYDLIHREQLASRAEGGGVRLQVAGDGLGGPYRACPGWPHDEAAPSEVITFERPAYDRHGGKATVGYLEQSFNHHWDVDRVTGARFVVCELDRNSAQWRLVSCRPRIVS